MSAENDKKGFIAFYKQLPKNEQASRLYPSRQGFLKDGVKCSC